MQLIVVSENSLKLGLSEVAVLSVSNYATWDHPKFDLKGARLRGAVGARTRG
jgi:hypothetical protein